MLSLILLRLNRGAAKRPDGNAQDQRKADHQKQADCWIHGYLPRWKVTDTVTVLPHPAARIKPRCLETDCHPLQQQLKPLFQPGVNRPVQNPVIPLS